MQSPDIYSWSDLLRPETPAEVPVLRRPFRILRRRGEPLLLVPPLAATVPATLQLYPAQSRLARCARSAMSLALRCHLPFGERVELPVAPDAGFPKFLRGLAPGEDFPVIAI